MRLLDIILGSKLANREYRDRKIGAFEGVPEMGLDGLGSSAYGPEAALSVLIPLGVLGLSYIGWIMAPILALLAILFISYWQTIRAYPNNGGAYIVARENLGTNASLLSAAALMTDYVLNVAVGISAGIGALISAEPALHPYILPLCLGILLIITLVNLRGMLDAGRLFALPTYIFVGSFLLILAIGIYQAIVSGGHPAPTIHPPELPQPIAAAGFWLLLRAFAAGCTAMTGVEAVSNGMSAFKEPPVTYGHRTLAAIVIILGALLVGITYLASAYGIGAMDQTKDGYQSVLSQLAAAIMGHGLFYYTALGSVICVLAFSANTSFVGFPLLCRMVAEDGYLPKPFAVAGRRLVFSAGILYLTGTVAVLLVAFGGITDNLIPLFAIGAFSTFTLSQTGMVVHWRRALKEADTASDRHRHRIHLAINAVGAVLTGAALFVIIVAKFADGAWITVLVVPLVIVLLKSVRGYYDAFDKRVGAPEPLTFASSVSPVVLVTIENWNKLSSKGLSLALSLSPDVIGVHLTNLLGPETKEDSQPLLDRWRQDIEEPARAAGLTPPRLVTLQAEYRSIHEPLLRLIEELEKRMPHRGIIILIPELAAQHWYQYFLHSHRARYLQAKLLADRPNLTVIGVPWSLNAFQNAAVPV